LALAALVARPVFLMTHNFLRVELLAGTQLFLAHLEHLLFSAAVAVGVVAIPFKSRKLVVTQDLIQEELYQQQQMAVVAAAHRLDLAVIIQLALVKLEGAQTDFSLVRVALVERLTLLAVLVKLLRVENLAALAALVESVVAAAGAAAAQDFLAMVALVEIMVCQHFQE
jgi:hypothetical protein